MPQHRERDHLIPRTAGTFQDFHTELAKYPGGQITGCITDECEISSRDLPGIIVMLSPLTVTGHRTDAVGRPSGPIIGFQRITSDADRALDIAGDRCPGVALVDPCPLQAKDIVFCLSSHFGRLGPRRSLQYAWIL